jgi:hypothetical protein
VRLLLRIWEAIAGAFCYSNGVQEVSGSLGARTYVDDCVRGLSGVSLRRIQLNRSTGLGEIRFGRLYAYRSLLRSYVLISRVDSQPGRSSGRFLMAADMIIFLKTMVGFGKVGTTHQHIGCGTALVER